MHGNSHLRNSMARSVERSLDTLCDLFVQERGDRGGQEWVKAHGDVPCNLSVGGTTRERRQATRPESRSDFVLLFGREAPIRSDHQIRLTDRFEEERRFAVVALAPATEEDLHITAFANEVTG
jgi:hypothetical protein